MSSGATHPGAFHIGEGWYSSRGQDASVTILCAEGDEITLPAKAWIALAAGVTR